VSLVELSELEKMKLIYNNKDSIIYYTDIIHSKMNYEIRKLKEEDYYIGFLELLEQLTTVSAKEISFVDFVKQYREMKSVIFVIHSFETHKIIGTASVLVEPKFIHKLGSVAHIEDVVVDEKFRGNGLGEILIEECIAYAKKNNCYKTILSCSEKNIEFYQKCGFDKKNTEMNLYF